MDNTQMETHSEYQAKTRVKSVFTLIFTDLEDKDIILENGLYRFNFASLFLKEWDE